ncbi:MAG: allophanate hydrolase, partial [Rhodospirillaceae bacterium]|nr:allophanate hydrolase [Rhodospirillaceae bacterium]
MLDFQSFDIISLRKAYEGSVTPKDVINEVYRRINEASDPGIFIHLIEKEDVFISAAKLNNCDLNIKPLWGIPFVIKDNIDAAG